MPEGMVLPKPTELSWVEAAGLPENWMTGECLPWYATTESRGADDAAYQALVVEGGMKKGDSVLIHAVSHTRTKTGWAGHSLI